MSDGPRPKQVDKPDADPNVLALGGFDVTALSVQELKGRGVKIADPILQDGLRDGEPYMTHSVYVGQAPVHDAGDRALARLLAHQYVERQIVQAVDCPKCRAGRGLWCRFQGRAGMVLTSELHRERWEAAPDLTLEGLVLPRAFPCLGTFRVAEVVGDRMALVQCDGCGADMGVRRTPPPEPDEDEPDPEPEQEPFGAFT